MIYFDHAASTEMSGGAVSAYLRAAEEHYANTASAHAAGLRAEELLEAARLSVARSIGADKSEIIFTSSGTEANNLALFGGILPTSAGSKIVTTAAEHDSVYASVKRLSELGYEVVFVPVTGGEIDLSFLERELSAGGVAMVSIMHANNETGAVLNVGAAAEIIGAAREKSRAKPLFHTDAVQSYCKLPFTAASLGADLISVSAHKIGGGKGAGALYVKNGAKIKPLLFGGGHEAGLRPSTVNLPQIAAFAAAAEEKQKAAEVNLSRVLGLYSYVKDKLGSAGGFKVHSFKLSSPYILSAAAENVKSEVMLNFLSSKGVYISAGAACSAKKTAKDSSRVLSALGIGRPDSDYTLRISFSENSTEGEADILCALLTEGAKRFAVR